MKSILYTSHFPIPYYTEKKTWNENVIYLNSYKYHFNKEKMHLQSFVKKSGQNVNVLGSILNVNAPKLWMHKVSKSILTSACYFSASLTKDFHGFTS